MRNLHRYEYGKLKSWRVRIKKNGKLVVDRSFFDSVYGGIGMAAIAAREFLKTCTIPKRGRPPKFSNKE